MSRYGAVRTKGAPGLRLLILGLAVLTVVSAAFAGSAVAQSAAACAAARQKGQVLGGCPETRRPPREQREGPRPNRPTAPGSVDGQWHISWTSDDVNYRGAVMVQGRRATISLDYVSEGERRMVEQECTVRNAATVTIHCTQARVTSGPENSYNADSFTLRRIDARIMRGSNRDAAGASDDNVMMWRP